MTLKENALRIIKFNNPECVLSAIPSYDISYFGVNHEAEDGIGHDRPVGSKWVDIWGTGWHKEKAGVMGFPKEHPLSEVEKLKGYVPPSPNDEKIIRSIYEKAAKFKTTDDKFRVGSHRDTLWEKSYMLVGMENMMTYFFTEPEFAREVLHMIMNFQLGIAEHYIKNGVEIVNMGDDLGTQKGALLGPNIVQKFLVPEYRRLFDFYKKHGVLINFHSCGNIDSVLETFIDLGVDVLNPLQATANNLPELRKKAGNRIAFMGGINSDLIFNGPVDKIKIEVKKTIDEFGSSGGYFCAPDQFLPFPVEHLKALQAAVENYGKGKH